jgi:hypothetical protein
VLKIIQIVATEDKGLIALDNNGTLWHRKYNHHNRYYSDWEEMDGPPLNKSKKSIREAVDNSRIKRDSHSHGPH